MSKTLTIKNNRVKIARYGITMKHVPQKHKAAPTNKGMWAFFDGYTDMSIVGSSLKVVEPSPPRNLDPFEDYKHPVMVEYYRKRDEWHKQKNSPGKWMYGWLDLESYIYVGWNTKGEITRSGFFNSGDWNTMTAEDAISGLRRLMSSVKAWMIVNNYHRLDHALDFSNLQIYIPKTTKVH